LYLITGTVSDTYLGTSLLTNTCCGLGVGLGLGVGVGVGVPLTLNPLFVVILTDSTAQVTIGVGDGLLLLYVNTAALTSFGQPNKSLKLTVKPIRNTPKSTPYNIGKIIFLILFTIRILLNL
jgi:hypothetical protein